MTRMPVSWFVLFVFALSACGSSDSKGASDAGSPAGGGSSGASAGTGGSSGSCPLGTGGACNQLANCCNCAADPTQKMNCMHLQTGANGDDSLCSGLLYNDMVGGVCK